MPNFFRSVSSVPNLGVFFLNLGFKKPMLYRNLNSENIQAMTLSEATVTPKD